jgi:hypothetical protein
VYHENDTDHKPNDQKREVDSISVRPDLSVLIHIVVLVWLLAAAKGFDSTLLQ